MGRIGKFFRTVGQSIIMGTAWLSRKLADFKILILSAAIVFLYIILIYGGIVRQNILLIVLSGIFTSLYFACVVFFALEKPSVFQGLITRLGFTLSGGKWSAKDKKRARCLWFFAVAPLFFVFWFAIFPTKMTGFIVVLVASCLLLLFFIGHWQKIPSTFWKDYYRGFRRIFPIILILFFAVYLPFSVFWKGVGKFAVVKLEQAASWLASSVKAEKQAAGTRKKTVAPLRKVARSASLAPKTQVVAPAVAPLEYKRVRREIAAPSADDDELSRAAEAGLPAFDQMRRELAELHAPKPAQKKSRSASPIKMPKWAE